MKRAVLQLRSITAGDKQHEAAARDARSAAFSCAAALVTATQSKESFFALPLKPPPNSSLPDAGLFPLSLSSVSHPYLPYYSCGTIFQLWRASWFLDLQAPGHCFWTRQSSCSSRWNRTPSAQVLPGSSHCALYKLLGDMDVCCH